MGEKKIPFPLLPFKPRQVHQSLPSSNASVQRKAAASASPSPPSFPCVCLSRPVSRWLTVVFSGQLQWWGGHSTPWLPPSLCAHSRCTHTHGYTVTSQTLSEISVSSLLGHVRQGLGIVLLRKVKILQDFENFHHYERIKCEYLEDFCRAETDREC